MFSKVRSKLEGFICWIVSNRVFQVLGGAFLIFCFLEVFLLGMPSLILKHLARELVIIIKGYVILGLF